MHASVSASSNSHLIFVPVLPSGAANNTVLTSHQWTRGGANCSRSQIFYSYTHTLTVNIIIFHPQPAVVRTRSMTSMNELILAASPGYRVCGVRLAALHRVWMKTHRESGEVQWAVSSQAQDFYTNSCLTCHENKAANKRNHPRDKRGEQSALTAMDKSNLRPQLSSSVNYNTMILMNKNNIMYFAYLMTIGADLLLLSIDVPWYTLIYIFLVDTKSTIVT